MNEIENNAPLAEDDEISLIDLFSVLIKHRFLIVTGTVVVAALCIFFLFFFPKINKSADKHSVTIEYTYQINSLPLSLEKELGYSDQKEKVIVSLANYNLTSLTFLAEKIKQYNPFDDDFSKMTSYQYNRYIQNLTNNKKYQVEISPVQTSLTVTLAVPEKNISLANQLVQDMVSQTNSEIENFLFPKLDAIEKSASASSSNTASAQGLKETQSLIRSFRASYTGFLTSAGEPFILLEPLGRLKKLIIVVFAAFFIFVFVAFLLNAVENIKKDPEASEKIKTAWDGGKITRKK